MIATKMSRLKKTFLALYLLAIFLLIVVLYFTNLRIDLLYYISVFLFLIGFAIYPVKNDFGSRVGMFMLPITAVLSFNLYIILFPKDNIPFVPIIFINLLFSAFCLAKNLLYKPTEKE